MDETKVRDALLHAFCIWGINSDTDDHVRFKVRVMREGLAMARECNASSTFEHLKLFTGKAFPLAYDEAIRLVLESELEYEVDIVATDTLKAKNLYGPPFYLWTSKRDPTIRPSYRIKYAFKGVPASLRDPLLRYNFTAKTQAEVWWDRWFLADYAEGAGLVFEAILACHAVHNEACFHCKMRNSIRWNGGTGSAWQDLICTYCNSTFEVKTKESLDKVNDEIERNSFRGGSFRSYCRHKNAIVSSSATADQKMFLVVMPRSFIEKKGEEYYPVFCMEIETVVSNLAPLSFKPEHPIPGLSKRQKGRYKSLQLQSLVKVKRGLSKTKLWFKLPKPEPAIDFRKIMEDAYIHRFGRSVFERRKMQTTSLPSCSSTGVAYPSQAPVYPSGPNKNKGVDGSELVDTFDLLFDTGWDD